MKQSINGLYILLVASLLLAQGCQVQQRRYTGGLSIQWPSLHTQKTKSTSSTTGAHYSKPMLRSPNVEFNFNAVSKRNELHTPQQEAKMLEKAKEIVIDKKEFGNAVDKPMGVITDPSNPTSILHHSQKSTHKGVQCRNQLQNQIHHQAQRTRPGDPIELIFFILGLLGAILGYDSYSGGGGGGGGGGGYFDWTVFWVIAAVVLAVGGVIAAIGLKGVFKPGNYIGLLILPFTALGLPAGLIGLIKSIRDYYDTGKYLSIVALVLLAVMWIIGLT